MPILHLLVASFIMPIFVLLSGYCGFNSLKKIESTKDVCNYNWKNFKRIYLPSLSTSLVLYCIGVEQFSTMKGILGGNWFLTMLFAVMLASSIFYYIANKISVNHSLFIFALLTFISLVFVDPVHIGEMIPYFLIGIILKKYNVINKYFCNRRLAFAIVVTTIGLFLVLIGTGLLRNSLGTFYRYTIIYFIKNGTFYYWLLRLILSTLICVSFIIIFFNCKKNYNKFSWIGSQTLPLYIFSTIPMHFWYNRTKSPMILPEGIYNFICGHEIMLYLTNTVFFILTITACFLVIRILEQWKFTRVVFLGKA